MKNGHGYCKTSKKARGTRTMSKHKGSRPKSSGRRGRLLP